MSKQALEPTTPNLQKPYTEERSLQRSALLGPLAHSQRHLGSGRDTVWGFGGFEILGLLGLGVMRPDPNFSTPLSTFLLLLPHANHLTKKIKNGLITLARHTALRLHDALRHLDLPREHEGKAKGQEGLEH